MKKLFLLLLVAGVVCACETTSIDEEINQGANNNPETEIPEGYVRLDLFAGDELTDDSRTAHSGGGKLVWSDGDAVTVNNKSYDVFSDGSSAHVYVPAAATYTVFYPSELRVNTSKMLLQPAQFYAPNSFGVKANPMYGTGSAETGVRLRSVCGVLKLTLTGSATISSIAVTDRAGGAVCGTFSYNAANGVAAAVSGLARSSVVLNCENVGGVKLNSTGVDFYIVLPAKTYASGLKISISDTAGKAVVIDSTTPRTIKVNDILSTPAIAYAPSADLLYAEYFDKNVWGADRQAGTKGFGNPAGANATGYEISNSIISSGTSTGYGTDAISTDYQTAQNNVMTASYLKSRALDNWQMLFQCREVDGALAVGSPTKYRGILRFPKLTNIAENEVCMAQVTFKVAFKNGASADADPMLVRITPDGPGCVLAYYFDGNLVSTPKDGEYWTATTGTLPIPTLSAGNFYEHLVIDNPVNNEIKDANWHTIRVDLGAVTNDTVIMLMSYSSASALSEFFIDDIEIRKVAYPYQDDAEHFVISKGTVTNVKKLMLPVSATASIESSTWMGTLSHLKSTGAEYVDLSVGWSFFYAPDGSNGDTAKWDEKLQAAKDKIDAAGLKVWHIHLPGIGTTYTKNDDGSYTTGSDSDLVDFAHKTESIRAAAVDKMSDIITHVGQILKPKYVLIHPSGWRDGGTNGAYLYTGTDATARKASLVKSLKELGTVAKSAGTTVVMENLGNYKSPSNSMTMQPSYINYFLGQATDCKFCFDFSHGTINLYNTGATYIAGLNKGLMTALHVHGGGNDRDQHVFPGYTGMYQYHDKLEWGETYEAVVNYGYRGPFTYEPSSYAVDCNASWSTIIHNYYNHVYPAYRKKMGN